MNSQGSIDEYINNLDRLTFRDLFKVLLRVRIRVVVTVVTVCIGLGGAVFRLGQYYQLQDTAISLQSPFSMKINKDGTKEIEKHIKSAKGNPDTDQVIHLERLYLVRPSLQSPKGKAMLSVNKIGDQSTDIVEFAVVTGDQDQIRKWPSFASASFAGTGWAQGGFDWLGQAENYKFREEYVRAGTGTIRRNYDNGAILEYKMQNGRSVPSSFRWIKPPH